VKATFNRKTLLEAFQMVASVAPSRSPKPILQNVKLEIAAGDDGEIRAVLSATDLEVGVRRRVDDVRIDEEGEAILPAVRLASILKSSSDAEVVIETTDDGLLVRAGRSKFKLPGEDPSLFPAVPDFDGESYAVLFDTDLGMLIRSTSFACDAEASARYALGGALVERGGETLSFVATDGRRLSKATAAAEYVGDSSWSAPVVPQKALKLIDRAIAGDGSQVHVAVKSGTAVMVRTENSVIYSRLLEGKFPDYSFVFPASPKYKIPLDVAGLKSAVDLAAVCASAESRGVAFAFDSEGLRLSASASDVGESDVRMAFDAPIDGLDLTVNMDPRFVGDVLRAADQDVDVELVDDKSAVVMRSGERCVSVIMPMSKG
jgi:DNA polymerase III subunit beta